MSMTLPLSASSQAKNHVSIVFILFHHSFMLFLLLIVLPPLLFSCVTLQDLAFTLTYHLSNLIIFPSPIILILQDFLSSSACCHLHHLVSFLFSGVSRNFLIFMITLGANRWWFYTFDLEICFAQRNVALFHHSNFVEFHAFWLVHGLRSTRSCIPPVRTHLSRTPYPFPRHEAVQKQCFSLDDLYQSLTWSERHCFCGNVAFSETARRQDSSFIKHIGRHLGLTYVSRGIIGRAPQTTSQVVSPFCARGFTYQSLSPSLPALARSILRCNLPKVVIVSSFVGWLNFIGLA